MPNPESTAASLQNYLANAETSLPAMFSYDTAAEQILLLYQADGGATFNLYFGNQAGQHLYAVCVYPDRSFILDGDAVEMEDLHDYLLANRDLLADPRCCIGVWYSKESGLTYLDISVALPNKRQVVTLGRRYNQEGIFDLHDMEYIDTGGNGQAPQSMPPISERLPRLKRQGGTS